MISELDPITQAYVLGWLSCLFSAMPIAMLFLLPHDGWSKGHYDRTIKKLEIQLKDHKKIIEQLIKDQWNEHAPSWPIPYNDQVLAKTKEKQIQETGRGDSPA